MNDGVAVRHSRELRMMPVGTEILNGDRVDVTRFRKVGPDNWACIDMAGNEITLGAFNPGFTFKSEALFLPAVVTRYPVPKAGINVAAVKQALKMHQHDPSYIDSDGTVMCLCQSKFSAAAALVQHQTEAVIVAAAQGRMIE